MPSKKLLDLVSSAKDPLAGVPQQVRNRLEGHDTPSSIGEFGEAAVRDVGDIFKGLASLPQLGASLVTSPIETGKQVVTSLFDRVEEVLTDPIGTFLRTPVSTALDFTGLVGLGRGVAAKAGVVALKSARMRKLFRIKELTEAQKRAREVVFIRHGNIEAEKFSARLAADDVAKKFDLETRQDMTFYAEQTRNPLRGDGPSNTVRGVEDRLKSVPGALDEADNLKLQRDEFWKMANESGYADEMAFLENYIPHFWITSAPRAKTAVQSFMRKNPHAQKRTVFSYEDGIAAGLEPLTLDAVELTRLYKSNLTTIIENNKMIKTLETLEVAPGEMAIVRGGGKIPQGYKPVNHRALGPSGGFVHPEIADVVGAVLEAPFDGNIARRVSMLNAFAKKAALSFSFFHHIALAESAFASLGIKGLSFTKKSGFRKGLELLKNEAGTKEALRNGLNLGAISDVQVTKVQQALMRMEAGLKKTPVLGKVAKGIRKGNDLWDKVLWDYWHTGLKSYAYHELYTQALKRSPGINKIELGRDIARSVNNAFGGQTWDLLMKSPKWQQAAHWILLAPDWTYSNIMVALSPFEGGHVGRFGRAYWRRSIMGGMTFSAMLNYALTSYTDGQGRFPWENEIGHRMDIQLPYKDDKGRRQYIKLGKQMREPLRWVYEPFKQFGAKLAPGIQIAVEQLAGTSTTGFPLPHKDEEGGEALASRAGAIGEKFVPFAFSDTNFGFALPRSAGTTGFKVINGLKKALAEKDSRAMADWMRAAAVNGYDPRKMLSLAKRDLARDESRKSSKKKAGR